MLNIDRMMEEFQSKSYDERLKISMNIITNLKERGNAQAQKIFDVISCMDNIPDDLINTIYKDFYESVERIKQEKVEGELAHFTKSRNYIENLRKMEAEEKIREGAEVDVLFDDF